MKEVTKAVPAPQALQDRFEKLYKLGYRNGSFVPGTENANQVKQLMVDLKKAGSFLRRFERHVDKSYDGNARDEDSVFYDFCRSYAHGVMYLRVVYKKDNLRNSEEISLVYTGDEEYLRWVD
jgi:hypothetical protein